MTQDDPIARFASEYERAGATEQFEVSRCALAPADGEGRPAVRFVLIKGFDADGFVFFTNRTLWSRANAQGRTYFSRPSAQRTSATASSTAASGFR